MSTVSNNYSTLTIGLNAKSAKGGQQVGKVYNAHISIRGPKLLLIRVTKHQAEMAGGNK